MGKSVIDKLYGNLIDDEAYEDLPETEAARKKVKSYIMRTYLSDDNEEAHKQWMELEKYIADVAGENEHQGFIYGFRYAVDLIIRGDKPCGRDRLTESIKSEYATLAVEGIDQTDAVVSLLKQYVPEDKFLGVVDTLCAGLNETKYAAFEQGFIRGIAATKGGAL